jgi:hypothetical protein
MPPSLAAPAGGQAVRRLEGFCICMVGDPEDLQPLDSEELMLSQLEARGTVVPPAGVGARRQAAT